MAEGRLVGGSERRVKSCWDGGSFYASTTPIPLPSHSPPQTRMVRQGGFMPGGWVRRGQTVQIKQVLAEQVGWVCSFLCSLTIRGGDIKLSSVAQEKANIRKLC